MRVEKFLENTIEEARQRSNVKHGVRYRFSPGRYVGLDCNSDEGGNISLIFPDNWFQHFGRLEMSGCIYHEISGHLKYYEEQYPVFLVYLGQDDARRLSGDTFIYDNDGQEKEFNIKKMDASQVSSDAGISVDDVVFLTRFFNDNLVDSNVVLAMGPEKWRDCSPLSKINKVNSYFRRSFVHATLLTTIQKAGNPKALQKYKEQLVIPGEFDEIVKIFGLLKPTYDEELLNEQYLSLLSEARRLFDLNPFWSQQKF